MTIAPHHPQKNIDVLKTVDPDPIMEMNMTPLIDVMLVLIVMLIITIPIQNHVVKLDQPQSSQPPPDTLPFVNFVDVDINGVISWNGEPMSELPALEAKMTSVVQEGNIAEVHIRPNRNAAYRAVASVLAAAQRMGVEKLGIIGNEQFVEDKDLFTP